MREFSTKLYIQYNILKENSIRNTKQITIYHAILKIAITRYEGNIILSSRLGRAICSGDADRIVMICGYLYLI